MPVDEGTLNLARLRMITADVENFQTERAIELLAQAPFREMSSNCRIHLQTVPEPHWKALAEIYTMHSFAPFSNLNFFVTIFSSVAAFPPCRPQLIISNNVMFEM